GAAESRRASGTGAETATAAALAAATLAIRRLGGAEHAAPASAPAPPRPPVPPPPPRKPAPPVSAESSDIAGTWTRYQQLVAAGVGPASLAAVIGGAPGRGPAVSLTHAAPVDIRRLMDTGARARERAQELREAAKRVSGD